METPGEFLRERREAQGKSLEEIGRLTNIRPEMLRNIEADLFNFAPAEVYVVGALTAYAKALGVDPSEVLERRRAGLAPPAVEPVRTPEPRAGRGLTGRQVAVLSVVVVILAGIGLVFGSRRPPRTDGASRAVDPAPSQPEVMDRSRVIDQPEVDRVVLEMSVRESTWVALEMDGERRYSALLGPGDWKRWEADSSFSVKIGNAGGVSLTLDGSPVDLPQERGRVVILELPDPASYEGPSRRYARPAPGDTAASGGF